MKKICLIIVFVLVLSYLPSCANRNDRGNTNITGNAGRITGNYRTDGDLRDGTTSRKGGLNDRNSGTINDRNNGTNNRNGLNDQNGRINGRNNDGITDGGLNGANGGTSGFGNTPGIIR